MHSSDEYTDMAEDPSDDDYDSREPSSPSTPRRSPPKRARHAKAQGAQTSTGSKMRKLSLFSLPAEIIDTILYDPSLRLRDHLALAGTCRALRAVYYTPPPANDTYASFSSPVWVALTSERLRKGEARPATSHTSYGSYDTGPSSGLDTQKNNLKHLWSDRFDETKMVILGGKRTPEQRIWNQELSTYIIYPAEHKRLPIRSVEWDEAIAEVAKQRITKTTAKSRYKLSDADLRGLPFVTKRNPHYRSAAPMRLYYEAAVEKLAYELHGGYQGHRQLLQKCADRAAKAKETRRAKAAGTWVPPTPKKTPKKSRQSGDTDEPAPIPGWRQLTPPPRATSNLLPMFFDRDRSKSPTPGPSRAAGHRGQLRSPPQDGCDDDVTAVPKAPTRRRGRGKKRASVSLDLDDDEEKKGPALAREQPRQHLATPFSTLGGATDTYGLTAVSLGLAAAEPSTPGPKGRRTRGKDASVAGLVKQEEDGDRLSGSSENFEVKALGVASDGDEPTPDRPPKPSAAGLPWLSPALSDEVGLGMGDYVEASQQLDGGRRCNQEGHISRDCPNAAVPKKCYSCGDSGHISRECPQNPSGGASAGGFSGGFAAGGGGAGAGVCYGCGQPGHISRMCPQRQQGGFQGGFQQGGAGGFAGAKTCYSCGGVGHLSRDCVNPAKCFNCGQQGHVSRDCPQPAGQKSCYNCGELGHISRDCPTAGAPAS
ncbi:hypothetical protein JCM3774_005087 [Rhodotorula dairenensis]